MTGLNFDPVNYDAAGPPACEDWQARSDREARKREAEYAAADAARAKQDDDFRALSVALSFRIEGSGEGSCGYDEPSGYDNPAMWEFTDDEAVNADLIDQVTRQIAEVFAPWLKHHRDLGFVGEDHEGGPSFFLIYRAEDEALAPAGLIATTDVRVQIAALPSATLVIQTSVEPINATLLFNSKWGASENEEVWGVAATSDRFRVAEESRDDWLGRVAVPGRAIGRNLKRWKRSGGNLKLFGLIGSASERSAGDRPIEWIIPGLFPRGYVSLLVGTKMSGKSTLLGEMAAVIDSECQTSRSVLGIEVLDRGVSAIVSGEDGDNFINRRAAFYSGTHGDPFGLVIDLATIPWSEALPLLHDLPNLDFLVIDPLRTILDGDEDASSNISSLFDDLNELARAKDCAIVVAHHLAKKAPRSLAAMLPAVRGSGVITDRPRVVVGMIDRGSDITEIGIIKRNVPPTEQLWGELNVGQLFRRDAAALTLVPAGRSARGRTEASEGGAAVDLIHDAIADQNKLGLAVRRTGKSELFEARMPQLAGLSRQATRDGVESLLAAGRVMDGPRGLQATGS